MAVGENPTSETAGNGKAIKDGKEGAIKLPGDDHDHWDIAVTKQQREETRVYHIGNVREVKEE